VFFDIDESDEYESAREEMETKRVKAPRKEGEGLMEIFEIICAFIQLSFLIVALILLILIQIDLR